MDPYERLIQEWCEELQLTKNSADIYGASLISFRNWCKENKVKMSLDAITPWLTARKYSQSTVEQRTKITARFLTWVKERMAKK